MYDECASFLCAYDLVETGSAWNNPDGTVHQESARQQKKEIYASRSFEDTFLEEKVAKLSMKA